MEKLAQLLRCWGKTAAEKKGANCFHPAIYHMFDVGHVAQVLLSRPASPRWGSALACSLGVETDSLIHWLPYVIALHDLGKVSASFQGQVAAQKDRLQAEGFSFGRSHVLHHTAVGQVFVFFDMTVDEDMPKGLRLAVRDMVAGHHGTFLAPGNVRQNRAVLQADEPPFWTELRHEALALLKTVFAPQFPPGWNGPDNRAMAVMALTGFTILCDWLGSAERFFKVHPDPELTAYVPLSRQRALAAVQYAGLCESMYSLSPTPFAQLFADIPTPRPLQRAVDAIPAQLLTGPCLAIIEAPTGEGKTEAALALAHRIGSVRGSDEFYYALPTTATSNQMFGRVQQHVFQRLGLPTQVKLVHSQAYLVEDDLRLEAMGNGQSEGWNPDALEWFGPKKRALLASMGVGTIDQAELGALNVRHTALRMLGLAGKVIILDEVHAYDTYMTTIICNLLKWLAAMGSSVILLSATLPARRRTELLKAFYPQYVARDDLIPYPSLMVVGRDGESQQFPPPSQAERRVMLETLVLSGDEAEQKAAWLLAQVQNGGCACWVTNTVERAQRLFAAIDRLAPPEVSRMILHARFPLDERARLERQLADWYGPQGKRPERGIVVGTQVLEQSLDVDFDVMVSDLAPVDLLLQRAGRLHRHQRPNRPAGLTFPRLFLCLRQNAGGALDLRGEVYAGFILRQTWKTLQSRHELSLPADYRLLIEAVYDAPEPVEGDALYSDWLDLQREDLAAGEQARIRLLPSPESGDDFVAETAQLHFEESETRAGWMIAQTRLAERSVTLIPLERCGDEVFCPGLSDTLQVDRAANRAVQLALMRRSLRVSRYEVVKYCDHLEDAKELPALFRGSGAGLLKEVYPLWLEDGRAVIISGNVSLALTLDDRLGLVIEKEDNLHDRN